MSPATPPRRERGRAVVAVVGAGVAGLAAAWELSGGAGGPVVDTPEIVVLDAADRIGGKLASAPFCGRTVDLAADGFLGRRPEAADLCTEVGLGDALRPVGASGAGVVARGRLRPLPGALALGVPTRFWPVARSGVLGPRGVGRLLLDVVAPRADRRRPLGDRAVGPLIANKLGQRVVDVLVDPLLGGISAGTVADMSTAASFPLLLAVAQRRGSFMKSLRAAMASGAAPGPPGAEASAGERDEPTPLFWALDGGLAQLAATLGHALEARGVTVRTGAAVELLDRGGATGPAWTLHTADGPVGADGIVLATPAAPAAALLEPHDTEAATLLRGIDAASVSVVTLAYPAGAMPEGLAGTGFLVPRATRGPAGGAALVTAATYLSQKWPHLARDEDVLVRASIGRIDDDRHRSMDDDALVDAATAELVHFARIDAAPTAALVTRWREALPQYRVNHLLRVTGIEAAVARLPALAVAGASYRGIGIPACVASGRTAARQVRAALGGLVAGSGRSS